jgi:hypothetical protein
MSTQNIPVMPCGDGDTRADNAALFGMNSYPGPSPTAGRALTASTTLLAGEAGKLFTNTGASGAVTATLPAPKFGMVFHFRKVASQILNVAVTGSGITIGAAGTNAASPSGATEAGTACITVVAVSDAKYIIWCGYGTAWAIT